MAMKIVRFNCCGMDVHKDLVVATIGITDRQSNITEYFQQSFSTLNSDLYRLKDWLNSYHCCDVCMESTGKYWIPIFNILEGEINVHLTHPKYVKAIKGKKTDKKDSNIKKRRGHKKAIITIARMMLVSIYHMILTGEVFQPTDYESFMNPRSDTKQSLTVEEALNFLKQSGIDISSIQINL